jgi:hypothetical protein
MPTLFYDLIELGKLIKKDMKENHPDIPVSEQPNVQFKLSIDPKTGTGTAHGVCIPIGNEKFPGPPGTVVN